MSGARGPLPVTAIIPAGNEAHQIRDAVASVLWADEVLVVVDERASDGTSALAAAVDPRVTVLVHEYVTPAAQKNWAIERARHEWVFILDADERPSPGLVKAIRTTLAGTPAKDAYWIYRKTFFMGRFLRWGGQSRDTVVRFFRTALRYQERLVHEEVQVPRGGAGTLPGYLEHYTFRDWDSYLEKQERYSTWGARQAFEAGAGAGLLEVLLRPLHRMLKQYVFRLGFLDGIPGAVSAYLGVYSVFLKYAKLWDMNRRAGR